MSRSGRGFYGFYVCVFVHVAVSGAEVLRPVNFKATLTLGQLHSAAPDYAAPVAGYLTAALIHHESFSE